MKEREALQIDLVPLALLPRGAGESSAGAESNGASGCAQVLGAGLKTGSGEEVRRRKNASLMQLGSVHGEGEPGSTGLDKEVTWLLFFLVILTH